MNKLFSALLVLLCSLLLAACGGGGGGGGSSSTPTPAPIPPVSYLFLFNKAWTDSIKTASNQSFTLTGTTNTYPVTGSGTITNTALSSVVIFNRYPAYSADETLTGTATVRGIVVPLNSADTNYYDLIYRPVGSTGDTNMLVDGNANIPITVQIGDSGTIYNGKTYSDSNFTTQIGTQTVTYVVAADPSSSSYALVTTTIVSKDLTGLVTGTTNSLIRMHYDGTAKRISTTTTNGSTSLVYTFP
jgi:hypothetical protein